MQHKKMLEGYSLMYILDMMLRKYKEHREPHKLFKSYSKTRDRTLLPLQVDAVVVKAYEPGEHAMHDALTSL